MSVTFLTNEDEKGFVKTINGRAPDENGNVELDDFPTLKRGYEWSGGTNNSTIEEIRFVEDYSPANYDERWDAGVVGGTITAYREGNIVTLSANGKRKIRLNEYSASVFVQCYKLKTITGLEMIDASNVTALGGMFAKCEQLTHIDLSTWTCDKLTKVGGMFQYCYELRSVKMPKGLQSANITVTDCMFEACRKLVEVDMGYGPVHIGQKMFSKCVSLERVTGLSGSTSVGDGAFIYTPKLKDIDLNPKIIESIGNDAFRLSSIEDCINMDDLKAGCTIGEKATREKRWPDYQARAAVQDTIIPTVLLRVPHAESQKRHTDVLFGHRDVPWDEKEGVAVDVSIAEGGCSALTLYHEWQCIHRGTALEKDNFRHYWQAFEGDAFADRNTDEMGDHFPAQAEILGWGHSETFITSAEQFDVILERLNNRQPTGLIMHSANIAGYHAVLVVGGDTLSGKLAVLDSSVNDDQANLSWLRFEDICAAQNEYAGDYDRLVVHTY